MNNNSKSNTEKIKFICLPGGDSLKAIKLSSEINKIFNLEFTTMELLETQTLGELFNKIYPLISYKGESK